MAGGKKSAVCDGLMQVRLDQTLKSVTVFDLNWLFRKLLT